MKYSPPCLSLTWKTLIHSKFCGRWCVSWQASVHFLQPSQFRRSMTIAH